MCRFDCRSKEIRGQVYFSDPEPFVLCVLPGLLVRLVNIFPNDCIFVPHGARQLKRSSMLLLVNTQTQTPRIWFVAALLASATFSRFIPSPTCQRRPIVFWLAAASRRRGWRLEFWPTVLRMVAISRRHLTANNEKHLRSSCLPVALFLLVGFILTASLWHWLKLVTDTGPCLACVALPIAVAFSLLCRNVEMSHQCQNVLYFMAALWVCARELPPASGSDLSLTLTSTWGKYADENFGILETLFTVNYNNLCFLITVQYLP